MAAGIVARTPGPRATASPARTCPPRASAGRAAALLRGWAAGLVGGMLLGASAGCMSHQDGVALRRDVDRLSGELHQEHDQSGRTREQLRQVIERATGLLTRNSADLGAQVEAMQQRLAQLGGSVEQLRKEFDDLQRTIGEVQRRVDGRPDGAATSAGSPTGGSPTGATTLPEGADALFALATAKLGAGDATLGRQLLRQFISRYAGDGRAAGAQLTLGSSLFAEQKYAAAIQEYRKVVEQYSQSAAVPEALYQIGLSFHQLKYCSDAESFLGELLKHHRAGPFADKANTLLKLIHRYRGDKRICIS